MSLQVPELEHSDSVEAQEGRQKLSPRKRLRLAKHGRKPKEEKLPTLSFLELLKLNQPDWYLVLIGVIASAIIGALFPVMSILFSEVLRVSDCVQLVSINC